MAEVFPIGFMMYFLYGVLALPAGYFADRWSKAGILRLCLIGMGISSISAGLSGSVFGLKVSLGLIGLFCGLYHPAGMGLIAHEIKQQGSAHGINGIMGNLGIASAPLFAGLALFFGDWRVVYLVAGAMGLIAFGMSYLLGFEETEHHDAPVKKSGKERSDNILYFGILCGAMTVAGLTYRANMTALPAYLELRAGDVLQWLNGIAPLATENAQTGAVGVMVSAVFLFAMAGQYVGGKVADRYDLRWSYIVYQSMSLPFALAMAYLYDIPLWFAAAGHVFFALGMQPIENSLVSKFLPKRWLSTGYGIKFTLVFALGSLAVYQVSYVEKLWGLEYLYPLLAIQVGVIVLLATALLIASRKTRPRVDNSGGG